MTQSIRENEVAAFGAPADVSENFDALAEHLAHLSTFAVLPNGVPATSVEPLAASAVDFTTAKWLAQVGAVQGWLHLPGLIPLADPAAAIASLTEWLGVSTDGGPAAGGDVMAVLDALDARVSKARQLADQFSELVEENDGAVEVATKRWEEAWDESEATEDEVSEPEPLVAQATTWSINDFSSRALQGKLNLAPSYQRSDVWPLSDRQLLIHSILRGIPLPSVILLKPTAANEPFEVVDGKQRLTTILRFIGRHPIALTHVREAARKVPEDRLEELFQTDYPKFTKVWKARFGETLTSSLEAQYYFPFKLPASTKGLPTNLHPLAGKYYSDIREHVIQVSGSETTVADLFEQSGEYKVPLIHYSKATQRQIHEVFNLYNKQGKHLNAEEIRNAIYHELELTRASLVVAGDADAGSVAQIAPSLNSAWPTLADVGSNLEGFNFGTSRYKRTKVLMWAMALLLLDTRVEDGGVRRLSTAQHINSLLGRVQETENDLLRTAPVLQDLFRTLALGISAHQGTLVWSAKFGGTKWQELQLVGSLVAVTTAIALHPDDYEERFEEWGDAIHDASDSDRLARPSKTQTNVQWNYVSRIVTDLLAAMAIDVEAAAGVLEKRFGSTGLHSLVLLASKLPDGPVKS